MSQGTGASQPDSGDAAFGFTVPEGSPSAGSTCQPPATLMTLIPQHHLTGRLLDPRLHTLSPLSGPLSSTSCFCNRVRLAHVGFSCFLLTQWTALTCERVREWDRLRDRLVTPQVHGAAHPQGCLRFCTTPRSILCVCVPYMCASECELSEKHAFWHKTCDITHFIRFEGLL